MTTAEASAKANAYAQILDAILNSPLPERGTIAREVYNDEVMRLAHLENECLKAAL